MVRKLSLICALTAAVLFPMPTFATDGYGHGYGGRYGGYGHDYGGWGRGGYGRGFYGEYGRGYGYRGYGRGAYGGSSGTPTSAVRSP